MFVRVWIVVALAALGVRIRRRYRFRATIAVISASS